MPHSDNPLESTFFGKFMFRFSLPQAIKSHPNAPAYRPISGDQMPSWEFIQVPVQDKFKIQNKAWLCSPLGFISKQLQSCNLFLYNHQGMLHEIKVTAQIRHPVCIGIKFNTPIKCTGNEAKSIGLERIFKWFVFCQLLSCNLLPNYHHQRTSCTQIFSLFERKRLWSSKAWSGNLKITCSKSVTQHITIYHASQLHRKYTFCN